MQGSRGLNPGSSLAKLLLEEPNLLLLDEPTNHLDLEARNWLETYLEAYPHAFVLISHDRFFLDVTVSKIAEIDAGRGPPYRAGLPQMRRREARLPLGVVPHLVRTGSVQRMKLRRIDTLRVARRCACNNVINSCRPGRADAHDRRGDERILAAWNVATNVG